MCKIASLFTVQQNQFGTHSFISLLNKQSIHLNMQWELEWILISSSRLCQHSVDIIYTMTQPLNTCSLVHLGKKRRKKNVKNFGFKGRSTVFMMATPSERRPVHQRNKESLGGDGANRGPYFRGVNHHELFFPLGNTPSLTSPPTHRH